MAAGEVARGAGGEDEGKRSRNHAFAFRLSDRDAVPLAGLRAGGRAVHLHRPCRRYFPARERGQEPAWRSGALADVPKSFRARHFSSRFLYPERRSGGEDHHQPTGDFVRCLRSAADRASPGTATDEHLRHSSFHRKEGPARCHPRRAETGPPRDLAPPLRLRAAERIVSRARGRARTRQRLFPGAGEGSQPHDLGFPRARSLSLPVGARGRRRHGWDSHHPD